VARGVQCNECFYLDEAVYLNRAAFYSKTWPLTKRKIKVNYDLGGITRVHIVRQLKSSSLLGDATMLRDCTVLAVACYDSLTGPSSAVLLCEPWTPALMQCDPFPSCSHVSLMLRFAGLSSIFCAAHARLIMQASYSTDLGSSIR
jgi:hypothetical protein